MAHVYTCPAEFIGVEQTGAGDIPTCSTGGQWISTEDLVASPWFQTISHEDLGATLVAIALVLSAAASVRAIKDVLTNRR
ncbi:hypothetical protein [Hydrocarboniphaga effusa]|uniref:hypothetical protein n=1 Tax=Hydrocarboniphaga effusa TaxID=243629 RepID=UPI00398BC0D4